MSELATYLAESVRIYVAALPWLLPGVAVAMVLGGPLSSPVSAILRTRRVIAYALVVSVGAILAATLPPGAASFDPLADGASSCHLYRFWLADAHEYLSVSEVSLNVLLFVPLGIALALLPRSRRTVGMVVAAFVLPVAIEAAQAMLPPLGRACESGDIVDNLLGLLVGLGIGAFASVVHRMAWVAAGTV